MKNKSRASLGKKSGLAFFMKKKYILTGLFGLLVTCGGLFWQYAVYEGSDPVRKTATVISNADWADPAEKLVALTFDDGPHPVYTEEILDVLDQAGIKASFFMMGKEAELYPDVVKKVSDAGHLIGNHTYTHANVCQISADETTEEITKTNDILEGLNGKRPQFFRPPFGCKNETLEKQTGMFWIFWDVDTLDWSLQNAEQVYCKVVKNVGENDIILMHDAYPSTVEAVRELIPALQEMGYTFVTVDRLVEP